MMINRISGVNNAAAALMPTESMPSVSNNNNANGINNNANTAIAPVAFGNSPNANAAVAPVNTTQTNNTAQQTANANQRGNFRPDFERLDAIRAEQRQWIDSMQQITRQLNGQLTGLGLASGGANDANSMNGLFNLAGMSTGAMRGYLSLFTRDANGGFSADLSGVSPEVRNAIVARAQEDIGEDGFWGVNRTSERIFSFAEALSGGDPVLMARMEQAVDRAFESVGRMFGGMENTPDITRQTQDAIRQRFDDARIAAEAAAESRQQATQPTTGLMGTA